MVGDLARSLGAAVGRRPARPLLLVADAAATGDHDQRYGDSPDSDPDQRRDRGAEAMHVGGRLAHTLGQVRSSIRSILGRFRPTVLSRSTTSSP